MAFNINHPTDTQKKQMTAIKEVYITDEMGYQMCLVSDNGLVFKSTERHKAITINRGAFDQHVNNLVHLHGWTIDKIIYRDEEGNEL